VIFARYPSLGHVKSRLLSEHLKEKEVLQLYKAFLEDTISHAHHSNLSTIILSLHGVSGDKRKTISSLDFLSEDSFTSKLWKPIHFQQEDTFGRNMKDAILWSFKQGFEKLIILGADTPHINPNIINSVYDLLSKYSVVLGPSSAGGIYLIGLNQDLHLNGFEHIFSGIELSNFARFISNQGLPFTLIEELSDIDQEEDLISCIAWLESIIEASKITSEFSKQYFIPEVTWRTIVDLKLEVVVDQTNNRDKRIIIAD
jgi:glycosyltransferase A (GT-A) superfamily protein (DUF2064 family)